MDDFLRGSNFFVVLAAVRSPGDDAVAVMGLIGLLVLASGASGAFGASGAVAVS